MGTEEITLTLITKRTVFGKLKKLKIELELEKMSVSLTKKLSCESYMFMARNSALT